MPWILRKKGNKYQIIKKTTGEVVGTSDSKSKGQASIRAMYASENKKA